MYSYNYNVPRINRNIPQNYNYYNQDRFIGPGFVAPLLLGGIAGYAIGNNRPYYYPYPYYYPSNPTYYNNFIYYPY